MSMPGSKSGMASTPSSFGGACGKPRKDWRRMNRGRIRHHFQRRLSDIKRKQDRFQRPNGFAEACPSSITRLLPTPRSCIEDWFSPFRDGRPKELVGTEVAPFPRGYNYEDQDLGSSGQSFRPEGLVLGPGKDGVLYVLDRANMEKQSAIFQN